jgi:tetratricopeptide (TPR) repeat protein
MKGQVHFSLAEMKGLLVAVLSLSLAGCGSLSSNRAPAQSGISSSTKRRAAENERMERVAKAHALYASAVLLELNAEPEAALEAYVNSALGDIEDETLVLNVSARLLQAKLPDRAVELLKKAAERPAVSGSIFARLGFVYAQQGKTDLALAANRKAIEKSPSSLAGYQNLFIQYAQSKDPEAALKVLSEAQRKGGDDPEFLMGLSEYYATLGLQFPPRREEGNTNALALLKRVDRLHPTNSGLRLKLADGFNLLGNSSRAAELYLELLKNPPEIPLVRERVHAKLAEIYLHNSDHKAAAEQLQAILKEDPSNPQIYYYLGSIALEDKRGEEAVDHFRKAIILNSNFEPAYYEMASALISLNRTSEALTTLEQAGQKFPQNFVREYLLAVAFRQEKAYPEALQHFTAAEVIARATDPKRLTDIFFFQVGATHERKGDFTQAEKYFQQSLDLAPDNAEVLNYLGYMWAEHGTNLAKAQELIEKALKLEPENAAYLDSMAWVLFQRHQPREALPYVERSVKLSEEPDAVLLDHLGDIHAALEQWEQACDAWRKSLLIEPSDAIRKKLEMHEPKLK